MVLETESLIISTSDVRYPGNNKEAMVPATSYQ